MKPQFALLVAGTLLLFTPGCAVFECVFGFGYCHRDDCCGGGPSCGESRKAKKCAKKCRKCRECLEEQGLGGMGYDGIAYGGTPFMDAGCCDGGGTFGGGGGIMMDGMGGGGGCGCGQSAPMGYGYESTPFMTPPMTVPTPAPSPVPRSGTALPPPIPPADLGGNMQSPPSTQHVSVEEFQRLPGVVISGPGSQTATTAGTQLGSWEPAAPAAATATSTSPSSAKPIQQAGWAPTRQ
jgi:hypothetical protein